MDRNKSIIYVGVIALLLLVGAVFLADYAGDLREDREAAINSFEECVEAGNPVMESFPEQCITKDGRTFTREIEEDDPNLLPPSEVPGIENPEPGEPISANGCFVGGCSGQICSDNPEAVSTCEWREEYACYQEASCEPQANGQCGWTQTPELRTCLASAR